MNPILLEVQAERDRQIAKGYDAAQMTLITIAPGIRVLRRHPDRDVLIVEGLGEYATLFIESIPGGWCVVNGEAATKRIYEQVRQCEEGGMDEQKFNEIEARHYAATPGKWRVTRGEVAGLQVSADDRGVCCMYSDAAEADADFIAHARQDVPDLLLEVRHLQADNRRLSDDLKHVSTALGEHLRPGQTPERAIMRIVGDLEACERERDAYRKAKAENDERFQIERDEARRGRDAFEARAQAYDALLTVVALNLKLPPDTSPDAVRKALWVALRERNDFESSAELAADRANRAQAERDELRLSLLAEQGDIRGAPDGWKRTGSMWFRPLGRVNHQVEVRRSTIHPTGEPYHWTLYTPTLTAEGYAPYAREAMKRADKAV